MHEASNRTVGPQNSPTFQLNELDLGKFPGHKIETDMETALFSAFVRKTLFAQIILVQKARHCESGNVLQIKSGKKRGS